MYITMEECFKIEQFNYLKEEKSKAPENAKA